MPSILVATGFVRIDSDTKPALKAIKAFGAIAGTALTTTLVPAAAAASTAVLSIASAASVAGAAVTAYGVAVGQQFSQVKEATDAQTKATDAQTKVTSAQTIAQRLAKEGGFKYGQQVKITADMTESAKQKAQAYNSALSAAQSSVKAASMAQEEYKTKLASLPPATQATAKALSSLKDATQKWSNSLAPDTMPVFTRGIQMLQGLLPKLTPIVRDVAREIDYFFNSFRTGLAGDVFAQFGRNVRDNGAGALRTFLDTARNLTVGFVGILNAFMPMSAGVTGGIADLTEKFAAWGATLGQSSGFAQFTQLAQDAGPRIVEFFQALAPAIVDVASAAGPLSGIGLRLITILAKLIDAIPTPVLQALVPTILAVNIALKLYAVYQAAATAATWLFSTAITTSSGAMYASRFAMLRLIASYILARIWTLASAAATALWTAATYAFAVAQLVVVGAIRALIIVIKLLGTALKFLFTSPIGLVILAVVALGVAIYLLWKKSETFRNIVLAVWNAIKVAAKAVADWFMGTLVPFFKKVWDFLYKWWLHPIIYYWTVVVPAAAKFLWGIISKVFNIILGIAKFFWNLYYSIVIQPLLWFYTKAIPAAAQFLWKYIVQAWNYLVTGVKKIWDIYYAVVIKPVLWFYTKAIPAAAQYLWKYVVQIWNYIASGVKAAWDLLYKWVIAGNIKFFTQTIPAAARYLRDKVVGWFGSMRDGLLSVYGWIRDHIFSPLGNFFTKTIPGWARTMRDKVKGFFTEMRDGIGTIVDGIKSKVKIPINWVLDHVWNRGIQDTWGKITGWIGIKNTLKDVKLLAAGGTVGSPMGVFNRPTAIVGEGNSAYPEFVIPTDPKYATRARSLWTAAGAHFMADGGIIGNAASGIAGFLTDPVGKAKKMLSAVLGTMDHLGSSPWVQMIKRLPQLAVNGLVSKVGQTIKSVLGSVAGAVGLGDSSARGAAQQYAQLALKTYGWGPVQWPALKALWQNESGWNPNAVNPSSGAYGIPQALGHGHPFALGDYVAQINWGLKYIKSRYGSPTAAWSFWQRQSPHWYDTGGVASGPGFIPKLTSAPERVLSPRQTAAFERLVSGRTGGGQVVVIERLVLENHGVIASRQEAYDWLADGLDQLRRHGRLT
jgi:hypothetical protein